MERSSLLVLLAISAISCDGAGEIPESDSNVEVRDSSRAELEALVFFARSYGYLRWFYPGVDLGPSEWNAIAVRGSCAIVRSFGSDEAQSLSNAIEPFTRLVGIRLDPELALTEAEGLPFVAVEWQHLGYGEGNERIYQSGRVASLGRTGEVAGLPAPFLRDGRTERASVQVAGGGAIALRIPLSLPLGAGFVNSSSGSGLFPTCDVADAAPAQSTKVVGIADVIVAWSVLQHFFPYRESMPAGWEESLASNLQRVLAGEPGAAVVEEMIASMSDGHGQLRVPSTRFSRKAAIRLELAGGRVVVSASEIDAAPLGAIVEEVDGRPVAEVLNELARSVSGSPHFRQRRALDRLTMGPVGTVTKLGLRDGEEHFDVLALRDRARVPSATRSAAWHRHPDGVVYVDLARIDESGALDRVEELATAPGLVLDLRAYPQDGARILLGHLTRIRDVCSWMYIPEIVGPDFEVPMWLPQTWIVRPLQPTIEAPVAVLVGPDTMSFGESILGHLAHWFPASIVGSPSAGANGDPVQVVLPSENVLVFTGMRVTAHDGAVVHALGVPPAVPVTPTLEGIRAGRDEVLEAGLDLVRREHLNRQR